MNKKWIDGSKLQTYINDYVTFTKSEIEFINKLIENNFKIVKFKLLNEEVTFLIKNNLIEHEFSIHRISKQNSNKIFNFFLNQYQDWIKFQ